MPKIKKQTYLFSCDLLMNHSTENQRLRLTERKLVWLGPLLITSLH